MEAQEALDYGCYNIMIREIRTGGGHFGQLSQLAV